MLSGATIVVVVSTGSAFARATEANARLIAAAPDLLAAAREVLRLNFAEVIGADDLRAAIAKAEGQEVR